MFRCLCVHVSRVWVCVPRVCVCVCVCVCVWQEHGLPAVVEWHGKRNMEVKINELQESLTELIMSDPPVSPADALAHVKTRKTEGNLPDA